MGLALQKAMVRLTHSITHVLSASIAIGIPLDLREVLHISLCYLNNYMVILYILEFLYTPSISTLLLLFVP